MKVEFTETPDLNSHVIAWILYGPCEDVIPYMEGLEGQAAAAEGLGLTKEDTPC